MSFPEQTSPEDEILAEVDLREVSMAVEELAMHATALTIDFGDDDPRTQAAMPDLSANLSQSREAFSRWTRAEPGSDEAEGKKGVVSAFHDNDPAYLPVTL